LQEEKTEITVFHVIGQHAARHKPSTSAFSHQFSVTNNINGIIFNASFIFSHPTANEQGKNPLDVIPDSLFYH